MRHALANLFRHRALIQSLVVRELKARYRGSVLGYVWSFVNPLLLLGVYWFVFTTVFTPPRAEGPETDPYALFLFCGLLPWTWFASALTDAANSLVAGGNLIKKLIFPAEVLPIVSVLASGVHFLLGLPVYLALWIAFKPAGLGWHALWLPLVILVQLVFTLGFALFLAALAVHFRDVHDLLANALTLWFFLTPIIYSRSFLHHIGDTTEHRFVRGVVQALEFNPMAPIIDGYHTAIFWGTLIPWKRLPVTFAVSLVFLAAGYAFFDRLRDSFPEEV